MPGKTSRRKRRQQGPQGRTQTKKAPPKAMPSQPRIPSISKPSSIDNAPVDPIRVSKQPEKTAETSLKETPRTESSVAPSTARAMSFLQQRHQEILRELRNLSIVWGIIILIFGAFLTTINLI